MSLSILIYADQVGIDAESIAPQLATERESMYKLTRTRGYQVVVDERPWG